MTATGKGLLVGVGVGPGDPELLTLKAVRALREADAVAWFAKRGNTSRARASAAPHLRTGVAEEPLHYPVTTEIDSRHSDYAAAINAFYESAAATLARRLEAGETVAVVSEGDPFLYGSYMHLHVRLAPHYRTQVIPGVSAMSAAWARAGAPIARGEDALTILPATLDEADLARRLRDCDAAVIIKIGRNLAKARRALVAAGLIDRAIYVERATLEGERTLPLRDKPDDAAPYFSLVLVPGWRKPK